jgi:hypothetical protein
MVYYVWDIKMHLHGYRKIVLEIWREEEIGLLLGKARFPCNR